MSTKFLLVSFLLVSYAYANPALKAKYHFGVDVGYIKIDSERDIDITNDEYNLDKTGNSFSIFVRRNIPSFGDLMGLEFSLDYFDVKGERNAIEENVKQSLGAFKLDYFYNVKGHFLGAFIGTRFGENSKLFYYKSGSDLNVLSVSANVGLGYIRPFRIYGRDMAFRVHGGVSLSNPEYRHTFGTIGISIPLGDDLLPFMKNENQYKKQQIKRKVKGNVEYENLSILFDKGSSLIKGRKNIKVLQRFSNYLFKINHKLKHVLIEGFADQDGPMNSNVLLSKKRAYAVKRFLVSLGHRDDLFSLVGYGDSYSEHRQQQKMLKDRKVEFILLYKKK